MCVGNYSSGGLAHISKYFVCGITWIDFMRLRQYISQIRCVFYLSNPSVSAVVTMNNSSSTLINITSLCKLSTYAAVLQAMTALYYTILCST